MIWMRELANVRMHNVYLTFRLNLHLYMELKMRYVCKGQGIDLFFHMYNWLHWFDYLTVVYPNSPPQNNPKIQIKRTINNISNAFSICENCVYENANKRNYLMSSMGKFEL